MRRRYINFRPICQARRLPRRPASSNWPAATPTGHFLSGPSSGPSCFSETGCPDVNINANAIVPASAVPAQNSTAPELPLKQVDL